MKIELIHGDCLEVLKTFDDNSVDSIVTDPPYGLSFMGKKWDYDVPSEEVWRECLRVLKPGGHILAFAGTRTQHRMAVRIEDAGFEIRDMIAWIYGVGFPKSLNISKAIDKAAGAEREKIPNPLAAKQTASIGTNAYGDYNATTHIAPNPVTDAAKQWEGWGTALKPALEPITVARKPLSEKTVAQNVLTHGTGGLNIDGCRVPANWKEERPESWFNSGKSKSGEPTYGGNLKTLTETTLGERLNDAGRFPANLVHDGSEEVVGLFPDGAKPKPERRGKKGGSGFGFFDDEKTAATDGVWPADPGGSAARFFYCAKASKKDRDEGNGHPTVKPTDLMRYLCRLVTPPGGIVLDPFMGSGSTGKAAVKEGFDFIGIEIDETYYNIAKARIGT